MLNKIISGGQTGADRGGLEAARILGIATGGFAPKNFMTERGPDKSLGSTFGLIEMDCGYAERTRMNVDAADATVVFRLHNEGNGTDKTIGYSHTGVWHAASESKDDGYKPVLVVTDFSEKSTEDIRLFIERIRPKILNIAGHRQSTAGIANFQASVTDLLVLAL